MDTFWKSRWAGREALFKASEIRDILRIVDRPEVISFAGGLPAPELFPVEEFRAACERTLAAHGDIALQYGSVEGYVPLREMIARHVSRLGIEVGLDNVLITSGTQQSLDLIGRLFLDDGDVVVCEEPTYLGAIQAWRPYGPRFVTLPVDEDGTRIEQLEDMLRQNSPKFLYLMPNFQNPAGVTLSELRRQRVVELAARYQVPIVEDDPNVQLRFGGEHLTPLYVLDADRRPPGRPEARSDQAHVLYLGTFSKLLAPGLRVGWVVGPKSVIAELVLAKQGVDMHTSTLTQVLAHEVGRNGFLDRHVGALCRVYRERRDAMLQALEVGMPAGVRWTHPDGGLFLWLTFPERIDAESLLPRALERGVAYVPGATFHVAGGGSNTARLNFSHSDPERIRAGVERLGRVVEEALAGAGPRVL